MRVYLILCIFYLFFIFLLHNVLLRFFWTFLFASIMGISDADQTILKRAKCK